jgi:RNA polymerase sigma factor (sigma-70 family)
MGMTLVNPVERGDYRSLNRIQSVSYGMAACMQDRTVRQLRDVALVERIRQNDADALDELARHYVVQLSAVASALLESTDLVQDVVQDVVLALWEHRARFDVRTNVAGYLHRAVYNRTISVLRHERSQRRTAGSAAELDTDLPRVARNDAEQRLEEADLDAQLQVALEHVPPSPRQVFLLSWEGGLTYEEIANLLGITTRSVSKQMYRATQRLALHFSRRSL